MRLLLPATLAAAALMIAPARAEGTAGAMLLVTWFYYNQPPSSYQLPFDTAVTCATARTKLMADAQRISDETPKGQIVENHPDGSRSVRTPLPPPFLSAICVAR
jgi:hypothetical protein